MPASDLAIVVGSEDGVKGDKFSVAKVVPHPNYGTSDFDYEFACIQVKGKFKWSDKVKPITLPKEEVKPKTDLVVAGWGSTVSVTKNKICKINLFCYILRYFQIKYFKSRGKKI